MIKASVIMPVHNNQRYIHDAVCSVLNQTYKHFELIVVDDMSTDSTMAIIGKIHDKRIKIIKNTKKLGLTKSLNKALKIAKGEYIVRMDGDDIALPSRLSIQISYLKNHPKIAMIGSWAVLIDANGNKLAVKQTPVDSKKIYSMLLSANPFVHPTIVYRKKVLEEVGFYNENYLYAQDYELAMRILIKYQGANIGKPLILYRVGGSGSISVNKLKQQELFALKARLEAITKLGYSSYKILFLIKPFFSFFLPKRIKIQIYRNFFWNR